MNKLSVLCAVIFLASAAFAAQQSSDWFDMDNCAMCKHLSNRPEMLENMHWEHHNISNGIVSVTSVKPEYMDEFRKASEGMESIGKRLQKGEKLPLCPMCTAYGDLMRKGAKLEYVKTRHGEISIMTSDKPKVVGEIKTWAKRTNEEMKKMHEAEHGKGEIKKVKIK